MQLIKGIGIDLVTLKRIQSILGRHGDRFRNRVFTEREVRYCCDKVREAEHLAVRFAAKEAFIKALPARTSFSWREVEVVHGRNGPELLLHGRAQKVCEEMGVERIIVSLTHEREMAGAVVIIIGEVQ